MLPNSGYTVLPSGLIVPRRLAAERPTQRGVSALVQATRQIRASLPDGTHVQGGTTFPTETIGSNEYPVSMAADYSGHILGTKPAYFYLIPSQVHVAVANTVHWDVFNADASMIVRILSILQIPNITTAVTGVVFDWLLERTTAVGTGGSALTAWLADSGDAALDADITARSKPTGGATAGTDLRRYSISSEETSVPTQLIATMGGLELVPAPLLLVNGGKGIVLRQNEGVRCVQETNSAAGNSGWLIGFTATAEA